MDADLNSRTEWPVRPWIMAAVGAIGGLLIHLLTDGLMWNAVPESGVVLRKALAAGVMVGGLGFLLTAERLRLAWAIAFAMGWGLVITLIGFSTGGYNRGGDLFEFPFLSGLLAVGIAAPLFQAMRDEGRRALPYDKVHFYAWTDAIIGGASLAFTLLTFALAFLLGALFDAIGIGLLRTLLARDWFGWMIAGAAFGTASAVLRERDPLLGTLRRLVMQVFAVLAPVLAFALAVYLVALPITGFGGLWKSGLPETPLLLSAAAFCFVLLNALIGDSDDERKRGRMWRWTEYVLLVAVLPLGVLALVSMAMRVGQYGWTPERIWGVLACLVAIAFGTADWLSLWRGRSSFDAPVRTYQKRLAAGLCALALLLALPLVDFGAISARSQLARLESGKVAPVDFDWRAMAFDFGSSGRRVLEGIAAGGPADQRQLAATALSAKDRYEVERQVQTEVRSQDAGAWLRVLPAGTTADRQLIGLIAQGHGCGPDQPCAVLFTTPNEAVLVSHAGGKTSTAQSRFLRDGNGVWSEVSGDASWPDNGADLMAAPVEVKTQTVRRLYVDGKPVGPPFE